MPTFSPDDEAAPTLNIFPEWHRMEEVDQLSRQQLDALPFGAIKLDAEGTIIEYNLAESRISGRTREAVLGLNFFTEVAPCTNVREFAGRFREGVEREDLNHIFPYRFTFQMQPTSVWVRLYYNRSTHTAWAFVFRSEDPIPGG